MTDDWSDDPSFDFDSSHPLQLPPSPPTPTSSASSTRSRISLSSHSSTGGSGVHASSPLRQSITSPAIDGSFGTLRPKNVTNRDTYDDDFDDFDVDNNEAVIPHPHAGGSSWSGNEPSSSVFRKLNITSTPHHSGVGTITKLAPKPKVKLSPEHVRSKVEGEGKDWEGDFDLAPAPAPSASGSGAKPRSGIAGGRATLPRGLSRNQLGLDDADRDGFDFEGGDDFGNAPVMDHHVPDATDFGTRLKAKLARSKEVRSRLDAEQDGFDNDDFGDFGDAFEDNEDEATIKAGDTMKAKLPPPRSAAPRPASSTSALGSSRASKLESSAVHFPGLGRASNVTKAAPIEDDFEADFDLPSGGQPFKLVPHAHQSARIKAKPRTSTSTAGSAAGWETPHVKSTPDSATSRAGWGTDDSSPGFGGKRGVNYETSATSITSATSSASITTPRDKSIELWDDDDDFAQGGSVRSRGFADDDEVGGIVVEQGTSLQERMRAVMKRREEETRKAEPEAARWRLSNTGHRRDGTDDTTRTNGSTGTGMGAMSGAYADESMEDGLVIDNPKLELSRKRMKQIRSQTPNSRRGNGGSGGRRSLERERDEWAEKERLRELERDWGKPSAMLSARDRAQHAVGNGHGMSGLRSQSATGGMGMGPKDPSARRAESPAGLGRPRSSLNAISHGLHHAPMQPPPIPPPTPRERVLKHQKSMRNFLQSPTPGSTPTSTASAFATLSKKQSMPSLHHPHVARPNSAFVGPSTPAPAIEGLPDRKRYTNSTSRLTQATSSSSAKSKQRPSIEGAFAPSHMPASGSASSMSSAGGYGGPGHGQAHGQGLYGLSHGHGGNTSRGGTGGGGNGSVGRRAGQLYVSNAKRRETDWHEFDQIEDLETDEMDVVSEHAGGGKKGSLGRKKGMSKIKEDLRSGKDKDSKGKSVSNSSSKNDGKSSTGKSRSKKMALVKPMNKTSVAGYGNIPKDMTWNPVARRWEGNEAILDVFDRISPQPTSTRPARITPLTTIAPGSAASAAHASMRVVGDMRFDPEKMCWVSNLAPEDDEPDPFEGWGDDEDEDGDGGGTIRARNLLGKLSALNVGGIGRLASESSVSTVSSDGQRLVSGFSVLSTSAGSVHGAGAYDDSGMFPGVPDELVRASHEAARAHRKEWRPWIPEGVSEADRERRERDKLWRYREITRAVQEVIPRDG